MNTTMADGAEQRLDAQIAEALFGQPGMSKMDVANRVRELRGDGPALLVGGRTGGSARLGDSLPPLPCAHYNACGDGSEPLYTSEQMRDYALSAQPCPPSSFDLESMLAACVPGGDIADPQVIADNIRRWFAAQPSPAVQAELVQEALEYFEQSGDAGDRKYVEAIRNALAARQPVAVPLASPGKGEWSDGWNACREAMLRGEGEALAARQPVGEPTTVEAVATVRRNGDGDRYIDWLTEGGIADLEVGDVLLVSDRAITDEDGSGEVFAAPPAQAVAHEVTDAMVDKAWNRFEAALHADDGDTPEDRVLSETIDQRDRYHEMADELAGHLARITGVDIGGHSSANCPWQNAIEAAEDYQPARAVDLGQFRPAVCAMGLYAEEPEDVDEAKRLLALIDSKAVGK
ncbi:TPA: hypothetical protein ACXNQV_002169 [Stenotrophomonas maltophilia]